MSLDGALVTDAHLRALLADGRAHCTLEGHEIIQSAPTAYVVDEARGVRDPSGMFCQRIGVAMHAVAVKPSPLHNLKLAVERCHLNVVGSLFAPYASGLATLTEDEKQLGATVIDMGGGRDLDRRVPRRPPGPCRRRSDGRPSGDVRSGAHAGGPAFGGRAQPRRCIGAALGDLEAGADVIAVRQMGEDGEDAAMRVPRSMLTRIIQARLEEIFGEVQARLRASRLRRRGRPPRGADRRRLPARRRARAREPRPEQAGAHRRVRKTFPACRRRRRVRTMRRRSVF